MKQILILFTAAFAITTVAAHGSTLDAAIGGGLGGAAGGVTVPSSAVPWAAP